MAIVSARQGLPLMLEREIASPIRLDLLLDGMPVQPTACSLVVYDSSGVEIVAAGTVATPDASGASYTVAALSLPDSLSPSDRWAVVWSATVGGRVYAIRQDAALVMRRYYGATSIADLKARISWLDRVCTPAEQANKLAEAETQVQERLWMDKRHPNRVTQVWAIRRITVSTCLALIFDDAAALATGQGGRYPELAERYRKEAEASWESVAFRIAGEGDDATASGVEEAGEPCIMLGGRPGWQGAR